MKNPLLLPVLALFLTQCTGPGGQPLSLWGPGRPAPYSDEREHYRTEVREHSREENLLAFQRGHDDGARDLAAGDPRSYLRHSKNYTETTRMAYQDGYDKGYGTGPLPGSGTNYSGQTDPAYSQGYDYGIRDKVAGRPADADAYAGNYDPRFRRSFERGYYDAYESRPAR